MYLIVNILFGRKSWDSDSLLAKNIILANLKYSTLFGLLAKVVYKRTDYRSKIKNYFYKTGNSPEAVGDIYLKVCEGYL